MTLAFMAPMACSAADPVPLDIKTGQWESTVTRQITGLQDGARKMPNIPPEQLAKLPPEQRAKIEAMMKTMGGAPTTTVNRNCVTKEDLAKLEMGNDRNQKCQVTPVRSSRSKQEVTMACDSKDGKITGTATFEAVSSESVKFNFQMTDPNPGGNGKPMNMTVTGTSKWLGAACSDAK